MIPRILLLLLVFPLTAASGVYRWQDKDGKVHYSDRPPPPDIVKVEEKKLGSNVIDTAGLPYAVQKAAKDFPATLYVGTDCAQPCGLARALLNKRGVPFSEVSLTTEEAAAAFRKRAGEGPLMVPSLTVGAHVLRGFEDGAWNRLLDEAGYPRNGAPGTTKLEPKAPEATGTKK